MSRYVVARRKSHPVRNVLIVILLVLVAYAACAGYSLYLIREDLDAAQNYYGRIEQSVSSGQLSGAASDTRSLCSAVADLDGQTDSWVWVVAERIPWIGEDVAVGRGLADVGNQLCNNALLPVVDQYQGLRSGSGNLSDLVSTVQSSTAVVSSCSDELGALGTSHFDQLNDAKTQMQQVVSSVNGLIGLVS